MERILIIDANPYYPNTSGRVLKSYFGKTDKERLAQFYTENSRPTPDSCCTYFQITDAQLLKKRFNHKLCAHTIYDDNSAYEKENKPNKNSKLFSILYKLGKRNSSINYFLRKALWAKKYWWTKEFKEWIDNFKPSVIVLGLSDDFYLNEIAIEISDYLNIPIIACITDDYYFNNCKKWSLFFQLYKKKIRKLIRSVFKRTSSAIYISEKMKEKYENEFKLGGEVIHPFSDFYPESELNGINEKIKLSYFGNISLGRYKTLRLIGDSINTIGLNLELNIFTAETRKRIRNKLSKIQNTYIHEAISYEMVKKLMMESDLLLIVEDFGKKNLYWTRYSLSTKVSDSISSGIPVLAAGNPETGCIDFLKREDLCFVCGNKKELASSILNSITNNEMRCYYHNKAAQKCKSLFSLDVTTQTFELILQAAISKHNNQKKNI